MMVNAKHAGVAFTRSTSTPSTDPPGHQTETARIICPPAECKVGKARTSARQRAFNRSLIMDYRELPEITDEQMNRRLAQARTYTRGTAENYAGDVQGREPSDHPGARP
jgi:hypothetical protein